MVHDVPVPVIAPGLMVHVPVAGSPLSRTLPVSTVQLGWVMLPIAGAAGVGGGPSITTPADGAEMHPVARVTVKLYVPAGSALSV